MNNPMNNPNKPITEHTVIVNPPEILEMELKRELEKNLKRGPVDKVSIAHCSNEKSLLNLLNTPTTRIIYISSDSVFDGKNPVYDVDDPVCPSDHTGKQHVLFENIVKKHPLHTILRVPEMYSSDFSMDSGISKMIDKITDYRSEVFFDNSAVRMPLNSRDVANTLLKSKIPSGLHHISGSEPTTDYKIAILIEKILGLHSRVKSKEDTNVIDRRIIPTIGIADRTYLTDGLTEYLRPMTVQRKIFVIIEADEILMDNDTLVQKSLGIDWDEYDNLEEFGTGNYNQRYTTLLNNNPVFEKDGAFDFMSVLKANNIAHCAITNAGLESLEVIKSGLKSISLVDNWVTAGKDKYTREEAYRKAVDICPFENPLILCVTGRTKNPPTIADITFSINSDIQHVQKNSYKFLCLNDLIHLSPLANWLLRFTV